MTYREKWGHDRTRTVKSDPRKQARRERAALRAAAHVCSETCKRFRREAVRLFVDDTVRRYGPVLAVSR